MTEMQKLVERCRHAESVIDKLADELGRRDPSDIDSTESAQSWFMAMTEARGYAEVWDGPSDKAFKLDDMST